MISSKQKHLKRYADHYPAIMAEILLPFILFQLDLIATISDKNCETRTPSLLIQCWLQICLLISGLGRLA